MHTIRIWFTKTGEAAYISLLDLQRVMGRALKRSGLPVWYTLGFNPHIYMTFTCPLSLGQESLVESVDVKTEEEQPDFAAWQQALEPVMPTGLKVVRVDYPRMKAEQIGAAVYTITAPADAAKAAEQYNALTEAVVMKKSKRGEKPVDLKAYLPRLEPEPAQGDVRFTVTLPASETLNLNPALLLKFLQERFGLPAEECSILRTALLTKEGTPFA